MPQSKYSKLALCAATGALAAVTAAGPAFATDSPAGSEAAPVMETQGTAEQSTYDADGRHHYYKGRVISHTDLNVRSRPTRDSHVVGSLEPGETVHIKCKVNSKDVVDGNPRWYRLADGKRSWASARYIENIGPAPHWC